jgi:dolichol-phosphate mannosyltransferase
VSGGVCVVVMAFNEAESLETVVGELQAVLDALPGRHELLIVDDGSSDGTGAVADRLAAARPGRRVIHHGANRGLGGVYRTGFTEGSGELLTFFPADGQFPAEIIRGFVPLMDAHDLVLGYLPQRDDGPVGRVLSRAERLLYRALYGPMPRFQGVFMVRRSVLAQIPLQTEGRGWGVVMEMVLRIARAGHRVTSVPTAFRPRLAGRSKVTNLRTVWTNLEQAVALRRLLGAGPGRSRASRS